MWVVPPTERRGALPAAEAAGHRSPVRRRQRFGEHRPLARQ